MEEESLETEIPLENPLEEGSRSSQLIVRPFVAGLPLSGDYGTKTVWKGSEGRDTR